MSPLLPPSLDYFLTAHPALVYTIAGIIVFIVIPLLVALFFSIERKGRGRRK